jgi:hypothetical protein
MTDGRSRAVRVVVLCLCYWVSCRWYCCCIYIWYTLCCSPSLCSPPHPPTQNMEYYFYRASLSPSRPALFAFQAKFGREDALKSLENMGLTTLFEYGALYDTMNREGMPTCDGKTAAQVEEMPPMVRDCSCTAANGCVTAKWSKYGNPLCDSRKFQTSWHPGWYVLLACPRTSLSAFIEFHLSFRLSPHSPFVCIYRHGAIKGNGMVWWEIL